MRSPDEIREQAATTAPDCIRATVLDLQRTGHWRVASALHSHRKSGFSRDALSQSFAAEAAPTKIVADRRCVARMKSGSRHHDGPGLHPGYCATKYPGFWNTYPNKSINLD
ncbi:conserved protein of unknown function [Ectopseudomonas oleovorans]|uniref:Uncharacterized protein n=1 Tax=Ectopseudomonas oleovorans TaxID=301 RepID=A0A653B260_ECTOL|nr:conserved protein of unknown function [Pseudomonas oleovorans]